MRRRNFTRPIMPEVLERLSRGSLSGAPRRDAQSVDRPGPRPDAGERIPDGFGGDALGGHGRLERRAAERQMSSQRRGMRAARAVRGIAGKPGSGYLDRVRTVPE